MRNALLRSVRATRVIAVWFATLAGAAMTTSSATATEISGLTVSLVPIDSGTSFVNGTFHVPAGGNASAFPFTLSVRVSGTATSPFDTSVFSTVQTWTASGGASVTNLFTATAAGTASILGTSVLLANEVGMVYRWSGLPAEDGFAASRTMNTNSLDQDSQRYWAVGVSNDAEFGTLVPLSGIYTGKEIARVRMALAPNVASGSFTMSLNGTGTGLGFYNDVTDTYYTVDSQSLNLQVLAVPEPATLAGLVPGLVVLGCVGVRRRMTRRTASVEMVGDSSIA